MAALADIFSTPLVSGSRRGDSLIQSAPEVQDSYGRPLAYAKAPKGGVTVQGQFYPGGQFIPAEVLVNATEEERRAVESGESRGKPLPPDGGVRESKPQQKKAKSVPTQNSNAKIVTDLKEMIETQADNFAKQHPWGGEEGFTREQFVKNWKKAYRKLEADPQATAEITAVVDEAFNRYDLPPVPVFIRKQTEDERIGGENAHWDNGFMVISDDVLGERAYHSQMKPLDSDRKYTVKESYPDPIQGLVVHEMGHRYHEEENPNSLAIARSILADPAETAEVRKIISGYAATRPQEMVAEAFAMAKHPKFKSLPESTQRLVEKILDRN